MAESVLLPDGTQEQIVYVPIEDKSKVCMGRFTWDLGGEKVKHEQIRIRNAPDGTVTREVIGTCYRKL